MLEVGIHENIVIAAVAKNEKGTLAIAFRPAGIEVKTKEKKEFSLEDLEGSSMTNEGNSDGTTKILMFPFKLPTYKRKDGSDWTPELLLEAVLDEIKRFRNQLLQIIGTYQSLAEFSFKPYANTPVNQDNYKELLIDEDILLKVYNNFVEQFEAAMKVHTNDDNKLVRVKFLRQSKEKHFPTLPSRYIEDSPFIEPMQVPKEQSKIKYSNYEKAQGLDSAEKISKSDADAIPETTSEASANVFGAR